MAFQLRPEESVPDGLRRLAKKELSSISKHLNGATHPRDETIHEARKSVKKVRAILEVVDSDHGRGLGKSSKRLQAISRRLSALRDADAMLEILHKLRSHDGHAVSARKAMARARKRQRADDFHEWRKQIKALWYELRLVEGASPRIRQDVIALHRAESWLGDEHNMVVLCDELSKDATICDGRADLDRIRLAADRFQCELREKALARAKRIYARRPGEYADAIRRAWKTTFARS
jgi:CHAD domain-containing protein